MKKVALAENVIPRLLFKYQIYCAHKRILTIVIAFVYIRSDSTKLNV